MKKKYIENIYQTKNTSTIQNQQFLKHEIRQPQTRLIHFKNERRQRTFNKHNRKSFEMSTRKSFETILNHIKTHTRTQYNTTNPEMHINVQPLTYTEKLYELLATAKASVGAWRWWRADAATLHQNQTWNFGKFSNRAGKIPGNPDEPWAGGGLRACARADAASGAKFEFRIVFAVAETFSLFVRVFDAVLSSMLR